MSRQASGILSRFFHKLAGETTDQALLRSMGLGSNGRGTLNNKPQLMSEEEAQVMSSEEAQASITQSQREEQARLTEDQARELMKDPDAVEHSMVRGGADGVVRPQEKPSSSPDGRAAADALAGKSRGGR